jgi:tetratricopeptide (TPR) repeat protein
MEGRQKSRNSGALQNPSGASPESPQKRRRRLSLRQESKGGLAMLADRPLRNLDQANKLIFVKEFDAAIDVLLVLCKEEPSHVEAMFRLVELAVRIEREDAVRGLLEAFEPAGDPSLAQRVFALGRCLLDVRLAERRANRDTSPELVNPSMNRLSPDASADADQGLNGLSAGGLSSFGRSFLGLAGLESSRRGYMVGKSFRVTRHPLVADDLSPSDPNDRQIALFDEESRQRLRASGHDLPEEGDDDVVMANEILAEVNGMLLNDPDDYAVWYVHGCACELAGNLHEAVESWKRAYLCNPKSLAVLSTLSELQQIGALGHGQDADYSAEFENLDRFAVHGTFATHMELYEDFLARGEFRSAIAALRTLADWLQKQKGSVPVEVEFLCLLGAMKAYRLEGNSGASESARREAENLAVGFKKSTDDFSALSFIAARAEDFELPSLARMCYFSILTSSQAPRDLVVKIAAHCVAHYASRALVECLRTAYLHFSGDAEIRFCQLVCSLSILNVPVKPYIDRRNKIREQLSAENIAEALSLLQDSLAQCPDDAEVHYYLAEIYARLKINDAALSHYSRMYELDPLNSESVVRFIHFLLKNKKYEEAQACCQSLLDSGVLSERQEGEVHWSLAAAAFASEQVEQSRSAIERALSCDPWNLTFIALAMRLWSPGLLASGSTASQIDELDALLRQFEDQILNDTPVFSADFIRRWSDCALRQTRSGFATLGFLMACAVFRDHGQDPVVVHLLAETGAAFNSRLAAQRVMLALGRATSTPATEVARGKNAPQSKPMGLGHLAMCIANIYAASGEWPLVSEWVDISNKSGSTDEPARRCRLLMLEAESLLFTGTRLARCRSLFEAVVDSLDKRLVNLSEARVLLGYTLVLQGDLAQGLERIEKGMDGLPTIKSLYFLVRACERCGAVELAEQTLKRLFAMTPSTPLESRLLGELHLTVGSRQPGAIVNLAC